MTSEYKNRMDEINTIMFDMLLTFFSIFFNVDMFLKQNIEPCNTEII